MRLVCASIWGKNRTKRLRQPQSVACDVPNDVPNDVPSDVLYDSDCDNM